MTLKDRLSFFFFFLGKKSIFLVGEDLKRCRTLCGDREASGIKHLEPRILRWTPPPPPQIRKVACAVIRRDSEPRLSVHVRTDASLSMPRGHKTSPGLDGAPRGLAFSFQCGLGRLPGRAHL